MKDLVSMDSHPAFKLSSKTGSRNAKYFTNTQQINKTSSDAMLFKEMAQLRRGGSKTTTATAPTVQTATNATTSAMNAMGLNIGQPPRSSTAMASGPPTNQTGEIKADQLSIKHVTPELAA